METLDKNIQGQEQYFGGKETSTAPLRKPKNSL
jgi:hypothetical protein